MKSRFLLACFLSLWIALLIWVSAPGLSVAAALRTSYVEDFTTRTYCDTTLTTAWWDTTSGQLALHPFEIAGVGGYNPGGTGYGVAVQGDLAYLADGESGLVILDVSDPGNPTYVGYYNTAGTAYGVAIEGSVAYVADYSSGFAVIDVDDPTSPTLLATTMTASPAMDVEVAGDRVYLAVRAAGVEVFDVSDPSAPVSVGLGDTPGTAFDLVLAGDYAYVADGGEGLQVLDISDPTAPAVVGSLAMPDVAYGVDVAGNIACVMDNNNGLHVIDITDPASPALLAVLATPGVGSGVTIDWPYAYVSAWGAGLHVVDLSDPTAPFILHTWDSPGSAREVALMGEYALLADYSEGLQVVAVRRTRYEPLLRSNLDVLNAAVKKIVTDGDLACVLHSDGLELVDISDPEQPTLLSNYDIASNTYNLALEGDHVFVAAAVSGLEIVDISDLLNPVQAGIVDTPGNAGAVAVAGDYAYVADSGTGLTVIDISDPTAPTVVVSCDTPGLANHVALQGNLAFVGDGYDGLSVVDISDPTNPVLLGNCTASGFAEEVAVAGDYAYLALGSGKLRVFDVSDPAAPTGVGYLYFAGEAEGLTLVGDLLCLAAYDYGVYLIDISDPLAPTLLGSFNPSTNFCLDVAVQGDHLYAASYGAGMHVCRIFARDLQPNRNQGQSVAVCDPDESVVRVRLTTVQTDSIRWFVRSSSTSPFSEIQPDGQWKKISGGAELQWRSQHVSLQEGVNPTCTSLSLEWLLSCALIDSVADVPDDQGGAVRLHFRRSGRDFLEEESYAIVNYGIWQRVDDAALCKSVSGAAAAESTPREGFEGLPLRVWSDRTFLSAADVKAFQTFPPGTWELITTVPAVQQDSYLARLSTVHDDVASVYCITAHTTIPAYWYCSPPDSGSSIDNIAPAVPTGLHLEPVDLLAWDPPVDVDFQYFTVYGSSVPELSGAEVLIDYTTDTSLAIPGSAHSYYLVTASDLAGNESEPAVLDNTLAVTPDPLPRSFALHPCAPNPFNPQTMIRYDVPRAGFVQLTIYSLDGRKVRTLVAEPREAGEHRVIWRGDDDGGRRVSSGVYLCRMAAGEYEQTRRMVLVQ